jgi:hypothetical protein
VATLATAMLSALYYLELAEILVPDAESLFCRVDRSRQDSINASNL